MAYEFTDSLDDFKIKMHATNVRFEMKKGSYLDLDTNNEEIKSLAEHTYLEQKFSEAIRVYILAWKLVFTSKDPKEKFQGKKYSYDDINKWLD